MSYIALSWSGGKDCALALYYLLKNQDYRIKTLFTTISDEFNRISMHGVRKELLEKQVESLNFPLHIIKLPKNVDNERYGIIMEREMINFKSLNIHNIVFGDIFLEDVRKYREANLSKVKINALFPLWGKKSKNLARKFVNLGFKAIITCVDSEYLDDSFIGQNYNYEFLKSIPSNVDPCGENGEFHTFVYDGPIFKRAIKFKKGDVVFRDNRFYFIDLI